MIIKNKLKKTKNLSQKIIAQVFSKSRSTMIEKRKKIKRMMIKTLSKKKKKMEI